METFSVSRLKRATPILIPEALDESVKFPLSKDESRDESKSAFVFPDCGAVTSFNKVGRRSTALVRDEEELELEGGRFASDKIFSLSRATPRPRDFSEASESATLPFSEEESSDESKSAFTFPG